MMREIEQVICSCGGLVEEVDSTPDENKKHGCGKQGCCVRAFKCSTCQTRFTFNLEAPEWNP